MSTEGVVLGLNAAFQRRVAFEKPLVIGAVNRAAESGGGVGGKGQGAYLPRLPPRPGSVALAQFYGGDAGDAWQKRCGSAPGADEALDPHGLADADLHDARGRWRRDGDRGAVGGGHGERAGRAARGPRVADRAGPAGGGLAAAGVPADFYSTCAAATLSQGGKFLIDAVAGLEDAVAAAASVGARMVLTDHARELLLAAGDPLAAGAADSVDDAARTAKAAHALADKLSSDALAAILWTDGPHPGGALVGDAVYALAGPSLPEFGPVLSPIGAGDTAAGTTSQFARERRPVGAFAYGPACGAASCLTAENAVFDADVAAAIHAGRS